MNTHTKNASGTLPRSYRQSTRAIPISLIDPEDFWSRAEKGDGCWFWKNAPKGRYASYWVTFQDGSKKRYWAHRVALSIHAGPIAQGKFACHSCDQPSCVNPNHLFPGTQQENLADMHSKGRNRHRSVKCEDNPNAELTAESVLEIRKRHIGGASFKELSEEFSIHQSQIARICRFKSWRMNGDPAPILGPENERRINVKLSWEKVGQIRNSSDLPIELARKFGVTVGLIHQVRRGLIWKESKKTV